MRDIYRCARRRARSRQLKQIVMDYYGCKCNHCGIQGLDKLNLDHVNNDAHHHKNNKRAGSTVYSKVIKAGFPDTYQLLCWNCNIKKLRIHLNTIHSMNSNAVYNRNFRAMLKKTVFDKYGSNCVQCGESDLDVLCIDHIHNDGRDDRIRFDCSLAFFKHLDRNTISDRYQILCYNCNCTKPPCSPQ